MPNALRCLLCAVLLGAIALDASRVAAQAPDTSEADETRLRVAWDLRRENGIPILPTLAAFLGGAIQIGVGAYLQTRDERRRTVGRFRIGLGVTSLAIPLAIVLGEGWGHESLPSGPLTERQLGFYEGIMATEARQGRRARWVAGFLGAGVFLGNTAAFAIVLADGLSGRRSESLFFGTGALIGLIGFVMAFFRTEQEKLWERYRSGELSAETPSAEIHVDAQGLSVIF